MTDVLPLDGDRGVYLDIQEATELALQSRLASMLFRADRRLPQGSFFQVLVRSRGGAPGYKITVQSSKRWPHDAMEERWHGVPAEVAEDPVLVGQLRAVSDAGPRRAALIRNGEAR